tara:strand:- start:51 stop:476 length:426 start_codon:yes stop_codon:yes gene_type:complete
MNHTYYVSTRYSNRAGVERVIRLLKPLGCEITYDWTKTFGAPTTPDYLCSIAVKEIEGVREADFVIVLLRGGYGTHTELGAALALDRPVILVVPHDNLLLDTHKNIVPFYHHPLVHKVPDISYIPNLIRSWNTLIGAPDDH